eukprot:SAG11_NODE_5634_length_1501_cov_1.169757_1_plen_91_part_00
MDKIDSRNAGGRTHHLGDIGEEAVSKLTQLGAVQLQTLQRKRHELRNVLPRYSRLVALHDNARALRGACSASSRLFEQVEGQAAGWEVLF